MSSFANNPQGVGNPATCRHAICAICRALTFGGNDDDGISNTRHSCPCSANLPRNPSNRSLEYVRPGSCKNAKSLNPNPNR